MSKQFSNKKRFLVFLKTNGKCSVCKKSLSLEYIHKNTHMAVDHLIPRIKGGGNNIENLFPICHSCNSAKKDHSVFDLKNQIIELRTKAEEKIEKKNMIIDYINRCSNGN